MSELESFALLAEQLCAWTESAPRSEDEELQAARRHPTKRGLVTVAGRPNDDLAPGTLTSILKQAGLKP